MLSITIPAQEMFNDKDQTFIDLPEINLELEHSLVSLSKWESKFNKPFLSLENKTQEETIGYIEAMILNPIYPTNFWMQLTQKNIDEINEYIDSKQSATTFGEMPKHKSRGEVITSELIYYWMIAFNIPFDCERWHLNRLFSLIRICNIKQGKPKKMTRSEIAQRNRELNAQRRAKLNTSG